MHKFFFIAALSLQCTFAFSQVDTVVIKDLTHALVYLSNDGTLEPVEDIMNYNNVGIFIYHSKETKFRICNSSELSLWVSGRFFKQIDNDCEVFTSDELFASAKSDTIYLNIYSKKPLSKFKLERIAIQKLDKKVERLAIARSLNGHFKEFVITALISLMSILGILIIRFPNRIRYVVSKGFSLKASSYELADFRLFNSVGLAFCLFLCALLGFFWIYFSFNPLPGTIEEFGLFTLLIQWLRSSSLILLFFLAKWVLASLSSKLFSLSKIHEYQIFDFINISLNFCFVLLAYFSMDFIFDWKIIRWQSNELTIFMPMLIALTLLIIGFKFINNFPHKKLLIISYLCATEIMPAILLIGWFYK